MAARKPVVQSRVVGKHRKGCYALAAFRRGAWSTPWALIDREQPAVYATKRGNTKVETQRRNNYRYLQFICNDTHCTAKVLVSEDAVLTMAEIGEESVRTLRRHASRNSRRGSPNGGK